MSLPPVHGHQAAREALARTAGRGALAQSLLIYGPPGIGKERLGLWLGQLLLCESPGSEPCGRCTSCRRAETLQHPDLHWFFPLPRPDGASASQLRDRLEERRAAELQLRREDPAYVPAPERAPAHFLASIRTLQELASVRPSAGRHKVFVVGDAEAMVPQESSPEAANAFLKLLEEPPTDTTLILTSSTPEALLPTIRSRVLPLRALPIGLAEVEAFLTGYARAEPELAGRLAERSDGAIGRALALLAAGDTPLEADEAAIDLLRAVLEAAPSARLALAHREAPSGGRGGFVHVLESFARRLRDLLAVRSGAADIRASEAVVSLVRASDGNKIRPDGILAAIDRVLRARELALGNVNPQLILASLLREVQEDLRPELT